MSERFFKVTQEPQKWADDRRVCHAVVTMAPWEHGQLSLGGLLINGRKSWGAPAPIWRNEVIYYNVIAFPLEVTLDKIVVHHTNNSNSVLENEIKQQGRGYAALGYHFFIDKKVTFTKGDL